jgi:hypothetical protein
MKHFITILLVFATYMYSASYTVPKSAYSVYVEDIDLDGDNDIVVGHKVAWEQDNPTISILENNGKGEFTLIDTSKSFCGYQENIFLQKIDNDDYPDIVTFMSDFSTGVADRYVRIYYNNSGSFDTFTDFSLNSDATFTNIDYGDIDGDNDIDLVFISNSGSFWGYMKNDGTGQFDAPVYYSIDERPNHIACDDINGDNIDDIVVNYGVYKLLIYYGENSGFSFDEIIYTAGYGDIEIVDLDNDGVMELITIDGVIGAYTELLVFVQNTEGDFELSYTKRINEAMTRIFLSDLNDDIYPEVIYNCSYYYPNSEYEKTHTYILFNESGISFADPVNYQTYFGTSNPTQSIESFVADMDGSGTQDIVTVNYSYNDDNCINILFQDSLGSFIETSIENVEWEIENYSLEQNYPNPFNNETNIQYTIEEISDVKIDVYNANGQFVQELVKSVVNAGMYSVTFRAENLNSEIRRNS